MRLIDADVLIVELEKDEEMFDREAEDGKQNPQNCTAGYAEAMWSRANGIRDAIISIYGAPTIDAVKVVHGRWIDKGWKGDWQFETDGRGNCWYEYECSECGFRNKGSKSNFCPNCGAKMDGERSK